MEKRDKVTRLLLEDDGMPNPWRLKHLHEATNELRQAVENVKRVKGELRTALATERDRRRWYANQYRQTFGIESPIARKKH